MSIPDLKKSKWDDLCHRLLNGLVAIKGMIRQYEVGMLPVDEMKNKIESRCRSMEKEIEAIRKEKIKHGRKIQKSGRKGFDVGRRVCE